MTHRIILTALLLLLSGCQQSPEQARRELAELGVEFTPSVFYESVENSDVVVVELFLTAGMNPDIPDEDDDVTPLIIAIIKNNLSVARALIDSGAKVDIQENGTTLLELTVELGHTEMVGLLLRAGARKIKASSLVNAKQEGYTEIVELLGSVELSVEQDYEVSAISSVRKIVTSQNTYRTTLGTLTGNYATDLEVLDEGLESVAEPPVAEPNSTLLESFGRTLRRVEAGLDLIDSALGSGTKDGYAFSTSGGADTFIVNARPLDYGFTGSRSFFSDESGVIRYTREDRPATVEDPPLEQ